MLRRYRAQRQAGHPRVRRPPHPGRPREAGRGHGRLDGTKYEDTLNDPNGAAQRASVKFIEDEQVFAASVFTTHENLLSCLADRDTPVVAGGYVFDQLFLNQHRSHHYAPFALNFTHAATMLVEQLRVRRHI